MSATSNRRKVAAAIGIGLLTAALAAFCAYFRVFDELESRTWDWRLRRIANEVPPDSRIKIIAIDQSSLEFAASDEVGIRWLWPRDIYEPILLFLQQAGAKAVAFDILFTESNQHVETDLNFAKVVSETLPVVSAVELSNSGIPESASTLEAFARKQQRDNSTFHLALPESTSSSFDKVTLPFPELMTASKLLGSVTGRPDSDGVFRHTSLGGRYGDVSILNLPLALAAAAGELSPEELLVLQSELEANGGKLPVRFLGGEQTFPTFSFMAVFTSFNRVQEGMLPNVPLEEFRDALVFVGMTAPGLKDLRPTPLESDFPGVEFNATVLDNVLNNRFIVRAPPWLNSLITSMLVLFVAIAVVLVKTLRVGLVGFFLLISGYVLSVFYAAHHGYWIELFVPMIAMTLALLGGLAAQYYFEGRQKSFIRGAFGHFVSPHVIDQIVADPDRLSLGGERRELTIFFSDIAGFTSVSEHLAPEELVTLLNEYLTALTNIILESGGTLDKYEGDAIIAFWNAPLEVEGHALKGVSAAISCQEKLIELKQYFQEKFNVFPATRIGLNSGTVTVGNFGSASRFDYTMIGDATNLAARLEGVNKVFGTSILISGATYKQLEGKIDCRRVGDVRVVGKSEVITIYEPLTAQHDRSLIEIFHSALEHFEQQRFEQAKELFSGIAHDAVAKKYLARIEEERIQLVIGAAWEPTWNLTSK